MKSINNETELIEAYRLLKSRLLGYINRQVNDLSVAEDLLHDVFIKAIKAGEAGTIPGNLSAWLTAITRNTVIDYYRSKRSTEPLPEHLAEPDEEVRKASQSLASCLRPLCAELPLIYRDTLLATDLGGKTMSAFAAGENVSVSAVKSRASRGRKLLKEKLLDCCHIELGGSGEVVDYSQKNNSQKSLKKKFCCL